MADDQIKKKDGTILTGQVTKVEGGQVFISSRGGRDIIPYNLNDIQSVEMAPPADMEKVKDAAPATVVATLEPLVKQYTGLPAVWMIEAMTQLAEAYAATGKQDQAGAMYNQIEQLYPGSPYLVLVVAGKAKLALLNGKVEEAITALKPLIDQANQNVAPSPTEGSLYAQAFLVYGQALEAQKKFPEALEAYLTVKTIFYQKSDLAEQADQFAAKLRQQNPGLSIE